MLIIKNRTLFSYANLNLFIKHVTTKYNYYEYIKIQIITYHIRKLLLLREKAIKHLFKKHWVQNLLLVLCNIYKSNTQKNVLLSFSC